MRPDTISRLDQLIRMRATGTPSALAERLGVTKRQVYNCINHLKEEFGAPIVYNSICQSYVYSRPGKIIMAWKEKI